MLVPLLRLAQKENPRFPLTAKVGARSRRAREGHLASPGEQKGIPQLARVDGEQYRVVYDEPHNTLSDLNNLASFLTVRFQVQYPPLKVHAGDFAKVVELAGSFPSQTDARLSDSTGRYRLQMSLVAGVACRLTGVGTWFALAVAIGLQKETRWCSA